ncbi:unnamed protein product, partial [Mesorhabditis belari]|uniref:Palmitoyltransferase n=1 Tax=Mesorhabditis belari TaxID=2138241 RepID=A0AAF3FEI1_9BILA
MPGENDDGLKPFLLTIKEKKRKRRRPIVFDGERTEFCSPEQLSSSSALLNGGVEQSRRFHGYSQQADGSRYQLSSFSDIELGSIATHSRTVSSTPRRSLQFEPTSPMVPPIFNKSRGDRNYPTGDCAAVNAESSVQSSTNGKRARKWEMHQGRNRFFCNGRFITSRQSGVFLFTVFLISTTLTLFFVFESYFLFHEVFFLLPFIAAVLALFVLSNLFRTSFMDPGILPRATNLEVIEDERLDPVTMGDPARGAPRTRQVAIRGQLLRLKYCSTCRLFRPPRSSHCSICDNCVLNFDHHCPWVGNCVGARNYRYFYFFITSLIVLILFIFTCCATHIGLEMKSQHGQFIEAIKKTPISLVICIICFFSVWSVVGLSGFHTYLLATNQTTNEDVKGTFSTKRRPTVKNPLCASDSPSLLDARGWVEEHPGLHFERRPQPTHGEHNRVFTVSINDEGAHA